MLQAVGGMVWKGVERVERAKTATYKKEKRLLYQQTRIGTGNRNGAKPRFFGSLRVSGLFPRSCLCVCVCVCVCRTLRENPCRAHRKWLGLIIVCAPTQALIPSRRRYQSQFPVIDTKRDEDVGPVVGPLTLAALFATTV